jgi:DNA-binding response OmpR family regulator
MEQPMKQPKSTPAGARVPRVLVVVRDHGLRDAVAAALAGEGYAVATTGHGPAALARIARWRPGAVLLDLRLPATDGGASLERYRRAAGPEVAIIGLAAFPVRDAAAQAARIGADAGLAMPLDGAELRELVRWYASQEEPAPAAPPGRRDPESGGSAAVAAALRAFAAQGDRHTPWMRAADLARAVGAAGVHDPQFEADVQALYAADAVRLMAGGPAGGGNFFEAMLVPPA